MGLVLTSDASKLVSVSLSQWKESLITLYNNNLLLDVFLQMQD